MVVALSYVHFDLSLFKKRNSTKSTVTFIEEVIEDQSENTKKIKSKKRKYKKRKYCPSKKYKERAFKLVGTYSKDHRYSDQKKIRRMYQNC